MSKIDALQRQWWKLYDEYKRTGDPESCGNWAIENVGRLFDQIEDMHHDILNMQEDINQ